MKKLILITIALVFSSTTNAQWLSFGTSMPSFVVGFEADSNHLYGYGQPSPYLYEWDGTDWQQSGLAVPVADGIHKLKMIDTTLYALAYTTGIWNRVYFKQGNSWQTLGGYFTNVGSIYPPSLYDIITYNGELYVCGEFNRVDNDTISGIAKWDGTHWITCGQGLNMGMQPNPGMMYPHQMMYYNGELLVVGNFLLAGSSLAHGIASWNGFGWRPYGVGFDKVVYAAGIFNGQLVVGGEFTMSGNTAVDCIAKWNLTSWDNPLFGFSYYNMAGVHPFIHTIKNIGNKLYMAGGFNRVTDATGTHVAGSIVLHDGNGIDTLYGGVNSDAEAIFPYQNGVLVGGGFNLAGNTIVSNVAFLQTSTGMNETIKTRELHVYPSPASNSLYIEVPSPGIDIEILDIAGRTIFSQTNINGKSKVNCSGFSNGIYFLRATDGKRNWNEKVIVAR